MKISILTPDFLHNCFGRAWLLAKVLQRHYHVEMIGPAFGDGIWGLLKNGLIRIFQKSLVCEMIRYLIFVATEE